jgi:osmotically-inducible protein OsmY
MNDVIKKLSLLLLFAFCSPQVFADVMSEPGATQAGEAEIQGNSKAAASGAAANGTGAAPSASGAASAAGATPAASGASATPAASGAATPAASGAAAAPAVSGAGATPAASGAAATPAASGAAASGAAPAASGATSAASKATPSPSGTDPVVTAIQASMDTNKEVSDLNVAITNKDGIVKLVGNINSANQAATLITIAESIKDVKDVDTDKLLIAGKKKISNDIIISAKIKGTMIREKVFNENTVGIPIKITVANGLVTLQGTVESQEQADKVVTLAKTVSGVGQVKSELVVTEKKKSS